MDNRAKSILDAGRSTIAVNDEGDATIKEGPPFGLECRIAAIMPMNFAKLAQILITDAKSLAGAAALIHARIEPDIESLLID